MRHVYPVDSDQHVCPQSDLSSLPETEQPAKTDQTESLMLICIKRYIILCLITVTR